MGWFTKIFSPLTDIVKEPIKQWGDRKKIKVETDAQVALLEAQTRVADATVKLRMAEKGQMIDADYDSKAQDNMKHTIMDEILTFILILPMVLLFLSAMFPELINQEAIIKSVNALKGFPVWYMALICGVYASYLGLRWVVKPLLGAIFGWFGKKKTLKLTDTAEKIE